MINFIKLNSAIKSASIRNSKKELYLVDLPGFNDSD